MQAPVVLEAAKFQNDEEHGIKVEEVPAGERPGLGRRLNFIVPTGHRIELFSEMALSDHGPMTRNPEIWREEPDGFAGDRFHHCNLHGSNVAFPLDSWHEVGQAADIIARYDIPLDIGPTRHSITRGQTIYFFDLSGNLNEVFSGGFIYYLEARVVDRCGKAVFYYQPSARVPGIRDRSGLAQDEWRLIDRPPRGVRRASHVQVVGSPF